MSQTASILLAVLFFSACSSSEQFVRRAEPVWLVSERGVGPLVAGMSIEEAAVALGGKIDRPTYDIFDYPCDYIELPSAPAGLFAMVVNDTIVRVDVDSTLVATVEGARVGDPASRILALYAGRVEVESHAYTNGHYLVVRPTTSQDSVFRLIFETYEYRVTRFRSGRLPAVAWIEGCA